MTKCNRCGKENPAEIHTCTPLALKLADEITETPWPETYVSAVAAELRRLHAENEALREALAALEAFVKYAEDVNDDSPELDRARAALARAGEKT